MSIWFRGARPAVAQRSVSLPSYLFPQAQSYANVDLSTFEAPMQSVALRATADLIASLGSELPVDVYSGEGSDRRKRTTPGYLLDPAGDGTGLEDWRYQVLMSWLLRGNMFGEELERAATYPTQIGLFHPDIIRPQVRSDGTLQWFVNGKEIPAARLVHRRVNPVPGQVLGLSPVGMHASTIGLSITATRYGQQWFADGAHPGGMLSNSEVPLDDEQVKTAKQRFLAALRGTREPVVMGKGWKYEQIQVSPEESQFLATQGYTEAQCARIFGPGYAEVLGYESGGSLTYATVEGRSAHLLVYSMNKWLSRMERLLSSMLPKPQYARINRDALLQATTLDRYRAHESALKNQWKTPNEVRELEDLAPLDGGDEPIKATPAPTPSDDEPSGAEASEPKGT